MDAHGPDAWRPLAAAAAANGRDRYGTKAWRLARLQTHGLPVLPGWVLPAALPPGADETALAQELLTLDPTTGAWILRSSSPLEDRPGRSAAGLFHSRVAAARVGELAAALRRVRTTPAGLDAEADPESGGAGIGVLAQPLLELRAWATVEIRPDRPRVEGWVREAEGSLRRFRGETEPPRWEGVLALVRRAAAAEGLEFALAEVGADDTGTWLLQLRPAPVRIPSTRSSPTGTEASGSIRLRGLGAVVHPGDETRAWRWDAAHSPLPLCPLLAGLFAEWIASDPGASPSRLIDGRWHDAPAEPPAARDLPVARVLEQLAQWERDERERVLPELETLERTSATLPPDPRAWRAFTARWLRWQRAYFAAPSAALRAWARKGLVERDRPPDLRGSVVDARARRLDALAHRIEAAMGRGATHPAALQRLLREGKPVELATALRDELERDGHLCGFAFDGRGRTWAEDPWPFFAELHRRASRGTDTTPNGPASDDPVDRILRRAEDDDDLLLRAYAAFRRAALRLGEHLGLRPAEAVLDLLPADLEAFLEGGTPAPEALRQALRRGRALRAAWDAALIRGRGGTEARAGVGVLRGLPAAPGRIEGPVVVGRHLQETIGNGPPAIAVVSTLLPADGLHLPHCLGIVCEAGDELGHAAVLCRERGLPCLIEVHGALDLLQDGDHVLLDADGGRLVVHHRRSRGRPPGADDGPGRA